MNDECTIAVRGVDEYQKTATDILSEVQDTAFGFDDFDDIESEEKRQKFFDLIESIFESTAETGNIKWNDASYALTVFDEDKMDTFYGAAYWFAAADNQSLYLETQEQYCSVEAFDSFHELVDDWIVTLEEADSSYYSYASPYAMDFAYSFIRVAELLHRDMDILCLVYENGCDRLTTQTNKFINLASTLYSLNDNNSLSAASAQVCLFPELVTNDGIIQNGIDEYIFMRNMFEESENESTKRLGA